MSNTVKQTWSVITSFLLVVLFIVSGVAITVRKEKEQPNWIDEPLSIIAFSLETSTTIPIDCFATYNGEIIIRVMPFADDLFDNYQKTLVFCISDPHFEFEWTIDNEFQAMELTDAKYGSSITAKDISKKKGKTSELWIRYLMDGNIDEIGSFSIQMDKEHLGYRGNGYYLPRLPWITRDTPKHLADDPSIVAKIKYAPKYNGKPLFSPNLIIDYHYSVKVNDLSGTLQYERSYPAPSVDSYSPRWQETNSIYPTVFYLDKEWERKQALFNSLGGIFIGIGASLASSMILDSISVRMKKREKK